MPRPTRDHQPLAALRAGQPERLRHAMEYRATVGDPVEILTTLLPLSEADIRGDNAMTRVLRLLAGVLDLFSRRRCVWRWLSSPSWESDDCAE